MITKLLALQLSFTPTFVRIVIVLGQLLLVHMKRCFVLLALAVVVVTPQFGGQAYRDVEHTRVQCRALDGIECASPRTFLRENKPCIK